MTAVASGPPQPRELSHEGLLYRDPAEFLAATAAFVRTGLTAGEPVLVAVPAPRLGELRAELGGDADRIRFLDMARAGRNPNRIIPWVLRAFVDEFAGKPVRIIGEPIWPGRAPEEIPLCVQHEALINVALADAPATVLCPYDATRLPPGVLLYAGRTHPVLVDSDGPRRHAGYADPYDVVGLLNQPLAEPAVAVSEMAFDSTGLAGLRPAVAGMAHQGGLATDRVVDLQLAVQEIASDALVHGAGYGRYRGWWQDDRMVCEIRSGGERTDSTVGRIRPAPYTDRGRGLLLANRLCDLVETYTEPGRTTTRLHMRR